MSQAVAAVGRPAPDFTLPTGDGGSFTLSGQRGKVVVLYFYPKDQTPTCTQEACEFRDAYGKFAELGAVVAGVSPDGPASHAKFAAKHGLPFPLLADEDQTVCRLYDVWRPKKMYGREYMGVERSTFLIDKEGVLVREWRKVKLAGHIEEVLAAVRELS